MDAGEWSAVIAGIALLAGTIVSVAAWLAARRSATAADTSAKAAETMAAIERERSHRENRPIIAITCRPIGADGAELELLLTGPQGVEAVKVEHLEIQDGEPWATPVIQGPIREQLAPYIRGPYEFTGKLTGQEDGGRTVEPFTLTVGYPHKLTLKNTYPPPGLDIDNNSWRRIVHAIPLRIALKCTQDGYEPWHYVHPKIPISTDLIIQRPA